MSPSLTKPPAYSVLTEYLKAMVAPAKVPYPTAFNFRQIPQPNYQSKAPFKVTFKVPFKAPKVPLAFPFKVPCLKNPF